MDSINPNFKGWRKAAKPDAGKIFEGLTRAEPAALSRALTLVESKLPAHRKVAEDIIHRSVPTSGNSIRLGITGVPGVGKSSFIEAFGEYLTSIGKKVAVLAIDPSSSKSRGSILGDKTRMNKLSQNKKAFIRPSPTAGSLGGVARRTRESIILCEAAGFDVVIIETVGVGQSETAVKSMVDFFMLLMLAGAGDELQGIKRGIMEMADLLLINKADGDNKQATKRAIGEYKRALHLFPPNSNEWIPRVSSVSSLQNEGIAEVWEVIEEFERQQKLKGYFEQNRQQQAVDWFRENLGQALLDRVFQNPEFRDKVHRLEDSIRQKQIDPNLAVNQILKEY